MKTINIGILAHVDAGKTTLSEAILYESGAIRNVGRVDNGDTLLDSNAMERSRGITIFSKQAVFSYGQTRFTLLDTPGHADFAAEMERTLQVLDYAILVISASDGVQAHTRTLWRLFKQYNIPVFIFVNKMDQPDTSKTKILDNLRKNLSDSCINMDMTNSNVYEDIAVSSNNERILDEFMNAGIIDTPTIATLINKRIIFPCYFGSALRLEGICNLLDGLDLYTMPLPNEDIFGARVYKITRDEKGNRLTHLRVTGGVLHVKDVIFEDEKVNQIRIYNGTQFETVNELSAGEICAITGPQKTYAGQGLGSCSKNDMELIEPVLTYRLSFDESVSARKLFPEIKQLEEELPELHITWNEADESIYLKLMGQVQNEILTALIKERFGVLAEFKNGRIAYKETISDTVIGVGHFEPLRHYAEVHLKMEPGERGSGLELSTNCNEDILDKNWQRLILTHLKERTFYGVATGSPLTDVKITVINGRAHTKHTEGGDFRQATYRAVRQGLMEAQATLLEPFYNFILDIPATMTGRAMTDIENLFGTMEPPETSGDRTIIRGYGPVATLRDYQINVNAYTSGTGSISVSLRGYEKCHNSEEVIAKISYDPEADLANPSSSVFCAHGSGFIVPWDQVKAYMHVSDDEEYDEASSYMPQIKSRESFDYSIGLDEIDEIFARTFTANKKSEVKNGYKKKHTNSSTSSNATSKPAFGSYSPRPAKKLLVVDGYNVIYAWKDLAELVATNMDAAKDKLIATLSNYQSITEVPIIVVFDGYKVKNGSGSTLTKEDITIVHTHEGETADSYIERFTHEHKSTEDITVATSDGLIQSVTRGNGCRIISSRELFDNIEQAAQNLRELYNL